MSDIFHFSLNGGFTASEKLSLSKTFTVVNKTVHTDNASVIRISRFEGSIQKISRLASFEIDFIEDHFEGALL